MKNKLHVILICLLFIGNISPILHSATVDTDRFNKEKNNLELPDIKATIEIFEVDNHYWFNYSVMNIGNAPADNLTVTITAYPFGTFPLRNSIHLFLAKILSPQMLLLLYLPCDLLKIWPAFLCEDEINYYRPFHPGEIDNGTSMGPFDYYIDDYYNVQMCIILECVVDPDNVIEESNEENNRQSIRFWFPLNNDPPI